VIFEAGFFKLLRMGMDSGEDGGVDGFEGADGGTNDGASASR